VVEEPDLILMRFWLPKHELRIVKPGYQPIVLALRADQKNYPIVKKAELLLRNLRHRWIPTNDAAEHGAAADSLRSARR